MAMVTRTVLVDDLDGGPAQETVVFCLDGVGYEIDLSQANADRLRGPLARYIIAGREVTVTITPSARLAAARCGGPLAHA